MTERDKQLHEEDEEQPSPPPKPRRKHWGWRVLRAFTIFALLVLALNIGIRFLYRGPQQLTEVVEVMPGVPIFPLSDISPMNQPVQRALAIPMWVMRLQGAKRTEAAQLQAPADTYFIAAWYRRLAPSQGWKYIGEARDAKKTRMIFLRQREGLQITIGASGDLFTQVQFIYLQGLHDKQLSQLATAVPKGPPADDPFVNTAPVKPKPAQIKTTTPKAAPVEEKQTTKVTPAERPAVTPKPQRQSRPRVTKPVQNRRVTPVQTPTPPSSAPRTVKPQGQPPQKHAAPPRPAPQPRPKPTPRPTPPPAAAPQPPPPAPAPPVNNEPAPTPQPQAPVDGAGGNE